MVTVTKREGRKVADGRWGGWCKDGWMSEWMMGRWMGREWMDG